LLECRSERIGETPDRSRPEFLVLRLEVQVMDGAGEVFGSFESALDKCLVDDHLGGDVRQLTFLPGFHLLSHRLKVSLHSINANRDAVDERKRLRVFCEDRRKRAWDNVSELTWFPLRDPPLCDIVPPGKEGAMRPRNAQNPYA